jgi:hypothetical protein
MSVNQRSRVVMSMNPSSVISETTTQSNVESNPNIRAPKDYMFARSDFTKEKEKLDEVLNTGVLFRYHEPDAKNIPVAQLEEAYCK